MLPALKGSVVLRKGNVEVFHAEKVVVALMLALLSQPASGTDFKPCPSFEEVSSRMDAVFVGQLGESVSRSLVEIGGSGLNAGVAATEIGMSLAVNTYLIESEVNLTGQKHTSEERELNVIEIRSCFGCDLQSAFDYSRIGNTYKFAAATLSRYLASFGEEVNWMSDVQLDDLKQIIESYSSSGVAVDCVVSDCGISFAKIR